MIPLGELWEMCPFPQNFPDKNVRKFHPFAVHESHFMNDDKMTNDAITILACFSSIS